MSAPARRSGISATDLLVEAMQEFSEHEIEIVTVVAMNADGSKRCLYSNARSEPEMFGMIGMAGETFTNNVLEEEEDER